ncbi:hypothetical protein [uncultured Clostridium sp.]|nr:hypothetical protein [uncultured Clostridium sp.]
MKNKREYTKENYLRNGTKSQSNNPKNKYVTTIEEPALNESGIEAKRKGF